MKFGEWITAAIGLEESWEIQENSQPITDYNPPGEMNKYVEGGFYGHPFIVGNQMYHVMNL